MSHFFGCSRHLTAYLEETMFENVSPASFDFDAIISMFPARNFGDQNLLDSGEGINFDPDLPDDPLFGLMDGPMMPFSEVSDILFGRGATM